LVCNAMLERLGKGELAGWRMARKASTSIYTYMYQY
jgi:hypothetical protein